MFGGTIQGSGSFDFAAPGGMNFAAPSFGSNATPSPDVSDNEGRFPGDDRAMKRQFGGSSTIQQNQPAAQQSGPFGQSSVNPFGASTSILPRLKRSRRLLSLRFRPLSSVLAPQRSKTTLNLSPPSPPSHLDPQQRRRSLQLAPLCLVKARPRLQVLA